VSRERQHQSREVLEKVDEEEKKEQMSPHQWKNTLREASQKRVKVSAKPPLRNQQNSVRRA
jgi:hypothetical protein